jgi:hypothetical protein
VYSPHPVMAPDEIRQRTQAAWDRFYSLSRVWARAKVVESWKGRLAFVLLSKLYRRMYANTGIATDSARTARSVRVARWLARPCRNLFIGAPMPGLQAPPPLVKEPPSRTGPAGTHVLGWSGNRAIGL